MKKNLILAVATVMAVGPMAQAAGGGKEPKPPGARAGEVIKSKEAAKVEARTGADAGTKTSQVVSDLKKSGLTTRLNPNELTDLTTNISTNPEVAAAAQNAGVQAKTEATRPLAEQRIRALAYLKDVKTGATADALASMSSDARIEQAYANLALNAGKAAEGWTPELRENLTFLLAKTNEILAQGNKTVVEAMKEANVILAKSKEDGGRSVRLDLNEVNKYCK